MNKIKLILMLALLIASTSINAQSKGEFKRTVFIEEFTTEPCGFCPDGARRIEEAIKECDDPSRVVWICHHAGFGNDWLTINTSSEMLWIYGAYGIYAPAMMYDRKNIKGLSPVMDVSGNVEDITEFINTKLAQPTLLDISLDGSTFNEITRELMIDVAIELGSQINDNLFLSVYISEDGIKARNQNGGIPSPSEWIHNNVIRKTLTGTWGEAIDTSSEIGSINRSFTFTVPENWVAKNLKIVAFVNKYDKNNVNNCEVINTKQKYIQDMSKKVVVHGICMSNIEGIEYSLTGGGLYKQGTQVTVTADASYNGEVLPFIFWCDSDFVEVGIEKTYTFNVEQNCDLYAYFGAPTSINEEKKTTPIKIYQSSNGEHLNIEGEYDYIQIFDANAKLVISEKQKSMFKNQINIQHLLSGIYIVKIVNNLKTSTSTIIKY